jgi:hypothetical protein
MMQRARLVVEYLQDNYDWNISDYRTCSNCGRGTTYPFCGSCGSETVPDTEEIDAALMQIEEALVYADENTRLEREVNE